MGYTYSLVYIIILLTYQVHHTVATVIIYIFFNNYCSQSRYQHCDNSVIILMTLAVQMVYPQYYNNVVTLVVVFSTDFTLQTLSSCESTWATLAEITWLQMIATLTLTSKV